MIQEKTCTTLQDIFYEELGRKNMNLLWQLNEVLNNIPVKHMLDVGGGACVSRNICFPESMETASIIDHDRPMLRSFIEDYHDDRIELVEGKIETVHLADRPFDLVLFIMSLLWIDDPLAALQKAASKSPEFFVLSNPEFSPEQQSEFISCFPEHASEFTELLEKYSATSPAIDTILESCGYYPLSICDTASWSPTPEHRVRTVFYTREKPDRKPYEKVRYIIQVNTVCNCNCPTCYVGKTGEHMDAAVFKELIERVEENEIISLRGGEPTLTNNLVEDFINPALRKGIHVILESNGAFINSPRYKEYLELLTQKNIEIRLSLDRQHIESFPGEVRPFKMKVLSRFIDDAKRLKIKFGLFSLGMSREQTRLFLEEYSVGSWLQYTRPITKYSNIAELPMKGEFVDTDGNIHDHITGVGWIGSPYTEDVKEFISSLT
ncbi:MAG: 4Fe-4S cluster-binding domain-containing protein [bacterium]|nr:4Fe-4S cluster-binding domain-containing protein [bacterium]